LSIVVWVDEVSKRFEDAWKAAPTPDATPRIEDYLDNAPEPRRSALLRELILLDLEYRRRRNDTPRAEEYLACFPTLHAAWLTSLFGERNPADVPSTPSLADVSTGTDLQAPERPTDRQPADRAAGGSLFGDYELFEKLGVGGMGVVYRARQRSANRIVALKLIRADRLHDLPAEARQQWLTRFQTEAHAAARIEHDHVVAVYEVGEIGGTPFYSMRFVPGQSLADLLRTGPVTSDQAAAFLEPVARAVHCAHELGILHRDLKPGNILVDARGRPYVTDFGLAKSMEAAQEMTHTGDLVGTPSYMSPEQTRDSAHVTAASDVYSLGATLYALLTGRPPFQAATPLDILEQVRSQEPVPVRQLQPKCPRDLETICLKCLQKEMDRRYSSAEALAEDLRRFQAGEPVRARPVSRRERVLKWGRRQPHLAAGAALLVFVFLAGFGGVTWQWGRAEAERRTAIERAEAERRTAYARAIAQADAEWRTGNAARAQQVLSECPPELCGWEWHYLQRSFHARHLATLSGHTGGVRAVAFSPSGTHVASGGADGIVKVWDRRTLREALTLRGHAAAVNTVAFSPDGQRLASGSADGIVRVWDAASGEEVAAFRGHTAGVGGLAFDPTRGHLATTERGNLPGGELKLWDPGQGKALVTKAWETLIGAVAFSPDGRRLAGAGLDSTVTVWDAATLEPVVTIQGQPERGLGEWTSVAYSADGRQLAAGSAAGRVRVWDVATGKEILNVLTAAQTAVSSLAFSGPHGPILAAASADNTVQGWLTTSGRPAFTLRGHAQAATAVAASPDGECLASGSLDRTVRLWDISRRDDDLTIRIANLGLTGVAFSPDGGRLASVSRDRALHVWDLATGNAVLTLNRRDGAMNGVAFSPDGAQLASADADGAVRLRDAATDREFVPLRRHGGPVEAVAYSPDGGQLASAGGDGTVRLWEVPAGRERLCLRGHDGPVHAVAFTADGRRLASGGEDGFARVWDVATGKELLSVGGPSGPVYAVAFSPDGKHLATACRDGAVQVWEATTGKLVLILPGHAGAVRALAYSPGGRLASAGDDRVVRLWDPTGRELLALRGHTEGVRAVVFSPDGHRLASADNRTIKVWDATPRAEQSELAAVRSRP
jgi:WD40 repeat protein